MSSFTGKFYPYKNNHSNRKLFGSQLSAIGYTLGNTYGDGNCQFYAISQHVTPETEYDEDGTTAATSKDHVIGCTDGVSTYYEHETGTDQVKSGTVTAITGTITSGDFDIQDGKVSTVNSINGGESLYKTRINSNHSLLLIRPKAFDAA